SIDFDDVAPSLAGGTSRVVGHFDVRELIRDPLFDADLYRANDQDALTFDDGRLRVIAVVDGEVQASGGGESVNLRPGSFCVLPASLPQPALTAQRGATFLAV